MSTDLPDLVGRWVEAWAVCRSGSPWTYDGSAWRVQVVGSAHRTLETFLVSPAPDVLARHLEPVVGHPGTWVTVFSPTPVSWPLPAGVVVRDADEALMTTTLARPGASDPRVVLHADGDRVLAEVHLHGERAAEGTVGVVGDTAVFDRIRTFDAFRRRGLGTATMAALTGAALERGATTGVLAASAEGQALYARLGWRVSAALVTLAPRS